MSGGQEAVITLLRYTNCFEDEIWLVFLFTLLIFIALLLWNITCCGSGKAFPPHYTEDKLKPQQVHVTQSPQPVGGGRASQGPTLLVRLPQ